MKIAKSFAIILLVACLGIASHAAAQSSSNNLPESNVSAENLALAEKLVDIMGFKQNVDQLSLEYERKYTDALVKANPEKTEMITSLLDKDFTSPLSATSTKMHDYQVKGFATRYTEQFLKISVDKYSSSAGQSALESQKELTQRLAKTAWLPYINKCKQDLVADLKNASLVVPVELTQ